VHPPSGSAAKSGRHRHPDSYRDYRLIVEFRWGLLTWGQRKNAARDSGVLVHGQGADGSTGRDFNGRGCARLRRRSSKAASATSFSSRIRGRRHPRHAAHQCSRDQDRDGEAVFDPNGENRDFESGRINWYGRDVDWQDTLGFRGRNDVESPYGEWTRLEVVAQGDRITNIVNGKVVAEGYRSSLNEGKILIQSEGAEIFVRRIDLEPLPEK